MRFKKGIGLFLLTLLSMFTLIGCGGPDKKIVTQYDAWETKINKNLAITSLNINNINKSFSNASMMNAVLVRSYSDDLYTKYRAEGKSEKSTLVKELGLEATVKGYSYKKLLHDLVERKDLYAKITKEVDSNKHEEKAYIKGIKSLASFNQDLVRFSALATPVAFNNSLADVANTLSSLSDGTLSPVMVNYKKSDKVAAGANLVGNSAFGYWANKNGKEVWVWHNRSYNTFSQGSNWNPGLLFFVSWSDHRPYSYNVDRRYRDYGTPYQQSKYAKAIRSPSALAQKGSRNSVFGSKPGSKIAATTSINRPSSFGSKNSDKITAATNNNSLANRPSSFGRKPTGTKPTQLAAASNNNTLGHRQSSFGSKPKPKPVAKAPAKSSGWGWSSRSSSSSRSSTRGGK